MSEIGVDGLFNYDVHEEIGRGATSVVYRATCRRGRLRNRDVALKKICPGNSRGIDQAADLPLSGSLHQSLHHPSIVSLFSTFTASSGTYHVLELCSRGTLSEFLRTRHPPVLAEEELRGVVRGLLDALIYLRGQSILHRDIKTSNILLTGDFRIKLSDFGLATRLPSVDATTTTFCGSPNYVAPEVVSRTPYGFGIDVWSLGCLMVTCLSGTPAFQASSAEDIFSNILRGDYNLPITISFEAKDLITGLLQNDPLHRIPLHRILSHPFFKPSLPVKPLNIPIQRIPSSLPLPAAHEYDTRASSRSKYPSSLSKGPLPRKRNPSGTLATFPSTGHPHNPQPLVDTINRDLRRILSDEVSRPRLNTSSTRRIVSAPQSGSSTAFRSTCGTMPPATPALTADSGSPTPSVVSLCSATDQPSEVKVLHSKLSYPILSEPAVVNCPSSHLASVPARPRSKSVISVASRGAPQISHQVMPPIYGCKKTSIIETDARPGEMPSDASPHLVAPTRDTLSTTYLISQTHKVSNGQIVVLPSKSLLVDFRESERRKGRKGKEVLVVSADGETIQVFDAPHLSTPCCLAEPLAKYTFDSLPSAYRKQYREAGRLVNQLKQRIPKLVMHLPRVRCTLMANEPSGDVELLFTSPERDKNEESSNEDSAESRGAYMRIRLVRERHSIEIARFITPVAGVGHNTGEWVKKVFPTGGADSIIPPVHLEHVEQMGLQQLRRFLSVCRAAEMFAQDQAGAVVANKQFDESQPSRPKQSVEDIHAQGDQAGCRRLQRALDRLEQQVISRQEPSPEQSVPAKEDDTLNTAATMATTRAFPSFDLPPRPSKFSGRLRRSSGSLSTASSVFASGGDPGTRTELYSRLDPALRPSAPLSVTSAQGDRQQIKFIPSVGWCVSSASGYSRHYRIMFQDGASLEVLLNDTGDDVVTFIPEANDSPWAMSKRTACERFPDRMKVFEQFLVLFSGV